MATQPTNAMLREFAGNLAQMAGQMAAERFGRVSVQRKEDNSPVTDADHAVQAATFDAIARAYPDHAVVGEETVRDPDRHASAARAEFCWIVDPIDGTRNYARSIPIYAVSIAVLKNGEPVAGAIHDASAGYTYSAGLGLGADCGGRELRMSRGDAEPDLTVLVSSFRQQPVPLVVRDWMDTYLFRNYGSLCLHLAWVAAGLADAAYAAECRLWDIAAGALLIGESGGIVTRDDGRPLWPFDVGSYTGTEIPILAGTPTMHSRLLASLSGNNVGD